MVHSILDINFDFLALQWLFNHPNFAQLKDFLSLMWLRPKKKLL